MSVKENDKPLNSQDMQEKLKGEAFPENWDEFLDDDIRVFFDELLEQTVQRKSDIIRKANISRTYGYQIMEGRRLGKRDYYLSIALAMSLDLKTTQRLLGVTQSGSLHPLIKRDAAVISLSIMGTTTKMLMISCASWKFLRLIPGLKKNRRIVFVCAEHTNRCVAGITILRVGETKNAAVAAQEYN